MQHPSSSISACLSALLLLGLGPWSLAHATESELDGLASYAAKHKLDLTRPLSEVVACQLRQDMESPESTISTHAADIDGAHYVWRYVRMPADQTCAVLDYPVRRALTTEEHTILSAAALHSQVLRSSSAAKSTVSVSIAPGRCSEGRAPTNVAIAATSRLIVTHASAAAVQSAHVCTRVGSELFDSQQVFKQTTSLAPFTNWKINNFAVVVLQDQVSNVQTTALEFNQDLVFIQHVPPTSPGTKGWIGHNPFSVPGEFTFIQSPNLLALRYRGAIYPISWGYGPTLNTDNMVMSTSSRTGLASAIGTLQGQDNAPIGPGGTGLITDYVGSKFVSTERQTYLDALNAPIGLPVSLINIPAQVQADVPLQFTATEVLQWRSDKDGPLGTSNVINVRLSPGFHLLTATRPGTIWQKTARIEALLVPDMFEQDDVRESAKALYEGQTHRHNFHHVQDIDWTVYAVGPNTRSKVSILADRGSALTLELYRQTDYPNGPITRVASMVAELTTSIPTTVSDTSPPSPAFTVYYVRAAARISPVRYEQKVETTINYGPDSFESDNSRYEAKALYEGQPQSHTFHSGQDLDWTIYAVGPGRRSTVSVTANVNSALNLQLYRQTDYPNGPLTLIRSVDAQAAGVPVTVSNTSPSDVAVTVYYVKATPAVTGANYQQRVDTQ